MLLPRFVKKLLAVLRGSVAPPLIFLSVLLGFWTGMMPGWSGLHTVLVVIVLILNVHVGLFILSLGLGKALSFAAAPVLYHVGVWVHANLAGLLSALSSVPIVGITDFRRYALVGGMILGPVVGAICGLVLAIMVTNFRRMMVKLDEKSEKFRTYYSKFWVRLLDRLLVGKRAKDVKAMFAKARYIRKAGLALAVLLVAAFLLAGHFLQGTAIKGYAIQALTEANKAEVNLEDLGISFFGGSVQAGGLQMTDPENPQQNQLAIEKMEADAGMYQLLLGRLVVEKAELTAVTFDQTRQTPGEVLEVPAEEEPSDANDAKTGGEDLAKLEKYVKDAKKLKEQLEKLRKWLPDSNEPAVETQKKPEKYSDYLKIKSQTPPAPKMLAKLLLADKIEIPSELFGNSRIEMTNLSDAPEVLNEPVTFQMKSNETLALLKVVMDYSKPGDTPEVTGTFEGFDLSSMKSSFSEDAGLAFQSGLAGGTFTGLMTKDQIDLSINLSIKELQAQGTGDGVFGMGASETSEVMQALTELATTIRVVGPTTDPRLVFDTEGLTKTFKEALVKAGKDRLANEIDKQIEEQLGDEVPEEVKEVLKKPGGELLDGLGGLLGGKKKEQE